MPKKNELTVGLRVLKEKWDIMVALSRSREGKVWRASDTNMLEGALMELRWAMANVNAVESALAKQLRKQQDGSWYFELTDGDRLTVRTVSSQYFSLAVCPESANAVRIFPTKPK